MHESALGRFSPVSKGTYENNNLKHHFCGKKLLGDARDFIRILPRFKIQPFRMSRSKTTVNFLPIFINETSIHNTLWLASLKSECLVEVTIDQVIPVRASVQFAHLK